MRGESGEFSHHNIYLHRLQVYIYGVPIILMENDRSLRGSNGNPEGRRNPACLAMIKRTGAIYVAKQRKLYLPRNEISESCYRWYTRRWRMIIYTLSNGRIPMDRATLAQCQFVGILSLDGYNSAIYLYIFFSLGFILAYLTWKSLQSISRTTINGGGEVDTEGQTCRRQW